jgi:hypothetical protein
MPFRLINEISDQSKALSLEFANSAFGLKQCKFALSGTLLSPRLVTKDFVKSLKGISTVLKNYFITKKMMLTNAQEFLLEVMLSW